MYDLELDPVTLNVTFQGQRSNDIFMIGQSKGQGLKTTYVYNNAGGSVKGFLFFRYVWVLFFHYYIGGI